MLTLIRKYAETVVKNIWKMITIIGLAEFIE